MQNLRRKTHHYQTEINCKKKDFRPLEEYEKETLSNGLQVVNIDGELYQLHEQNGKTYLVPYYG